MSEAESSLDALRRRLGPTDELQIRLLMSIPPERRVRTMMDTAESFMDGWRARLRRAHPDKSDLETCLMLFKWLYRNG
jgi:hypothetical protein